MGMYLNNTAGYIMYSEVVNSPYFVDKTAIIDEIISRIGTTEKYICITIRAILTALRESL